MENVQVFTCESHGEYAAQRADKSWQDECPGCAAEANAVERQWRGDWSRWLRFDESRIPQRFYPSTLEGWQADTPALVAVKNVIGEWCNRLPRDNEGIGLYLSGPPGVGKTHLAVACLVECLRRTHWAVMYVQWGAMLAEAKAFYRNGERDAADPMDALRELPLVVLDEVGVRAGTEFDATSLFDVIDARYRDGLATIVVTNATHADAAGVMGERVVDRLREMALPIVITGNSRRTAVRGLGEGRPPFDEPPEHIQVPSCWRGSNRQLWVSRDGSMSAMKPRPKNPNLRPLPSRGADPRSGRR